MLARVYCESMDSHVDETKQTKMRVTSPDPRSMDLGYDDPRDPIEHLMAIWHTRSRAGGKVCMLRRALLHAYLARSLPQVAIATMEPLVVPNRDSGSMTPQIVRSSDRQIVDPWVMIHEPKTIKYLISGAQMVPRRYL